MIARFAKRVSLVLVLTAVPGAAGDAPAWTSLALAQGSIDCLSPPPSSAATPAADPTIPAASPVAVVPFPAGGGELTVFAAASLTDAFEQIKSGLEATNERLTITFNFAGSQVLATQLAEGAEADVFASANQTQMDVAIENGTIAGAAVTFVRNRLTIVVPADNPAGIQSPADLARDGVRLVLAAPDVPVGRYAREAICAMATDPGTYGNGFVGAVAANIVSEEEDVRDVLTRVQLGEADAGIVYVSDVVSIGSTDVATIEIPEPVNVLASYPIAAVEGGDGALAAAFITYLLGPDGQATLQQAGFEPAR